jgi:hypothetical protein
MSEDLTGGVPGDDFPAHPRFTLVSESVAATTPHTIVHDFRLHCQSESVTIRRSGQPVLLGPMIIGPGPGLVHSKRRRRCRQF